MDIYWTVAGGADPITWLKKYGSRYRLLHIKDMKPRKQFSGDGNDASQWIELFPLMASAGDGDLEVQEIVETAYSTGVEHFFVEQDMVANPGIALARSFDFLNSLR
jgi:sugar phosphate isomerase/epimerase